MSLEGQTAVVTGASSGIGRAIATDLRAAGMKLVVSARRAGRLEKLAEQLGDAVAVPGDLLDETLPRKLIDVACNEFGRCDVVINNAGLIETGTVDAVDIDRICYMVRVNVEATFRMAYEAVKFFKTAGHGHLVNISSILGTKTRPTAGAYAGSKHAIEALSEALRIELARTRVKVSVIQPGLVLTELHDRLDAHPMKSMDIPTPLEPADIARAVRFILEQPEHVRIARMLVLPGDQEL